MSDVVIPPDLQPAEEEVQFIYDGSGVARNAMGGGAIGRFTTEAPQRLRVTQRWRALTGSDLARMLAITQRVEGRKHSLRTFVGVDNRGSMDQTELVWNPTFSYGVNSWLGSNGVLKNAGREAEFVNSGGITGYVRFINTYAWPSSSAFVTRSALYPLRAGLSNSMGSNVFLAGGTVIKQGVRLGGGYTVIGEISSGAYYYPGVQVGSWAQGLHAAVSWLSMSAALMTGSAANPGATELFIKAAPNSTAGVLMAGDQIEVNNELKWVTQHFCTMSGGLGYLQFAPPLVNSVSFDKVVITTKPMGRYALTDNPKWTNRYGAYGDLELTMETVYEP